MGGCTVLSMGAPVMMGFAIVLGFFGIPVGAVINTIAAELNRRALALEVESLGYDAQVRQQVGRAYQRAIRSFIPRFSLRQKREACRKRLVEARTKSLPKG
jgi:hypothetical protein